MNTASLITKALGLFASIEVRQDRINELKREIEAQRRALARYTAVLTHLEIIAKVEGDSEERGKIADALDRLKA